MTRRPPDRLRMSPIMIARHEPIESGILDAPARFRIEPSSISTAPIVRLQVRQRRGPFFRWVTIDSGLAAAEAIYLDPRDDVEEAKQRLLLKQVALKAYRNRTLTA